MAPSDTKYRRFMFCGRPVSTLGRGPTSHSGDRYGTQNLSTRSRSPASLGSLGSQSQRDIGVTAIPQPLLIGSHDGRSSVEDDVQLTSWNDPSARFANNAELGL